MAPVNSFAAIAVVCVVVATQVLAQTAPDIVTLAHRVDKAEQASAGTSSGAATLADRSMRETELQEIKDDLTYLRVKSRRGERVSDDERRALAERLDRFESRMPRGGAESGDTDGAEVPVGTELDARLEGRLSSKDAKVEDRVEATTAADLLRGDRVLVPAGSLLTGQVTSVDRASRTERKGAVTVRFDRIRIGSDTFSLRASVVGALESAGLRGESGRIGAGAGVGAILGGVLGGLKGAIAGIVIGGTGAVVATEGKDVELPSGTILRIRLDSPLVLR